MNQYKTTPEFILAESVKTHPMANQQACIRRDWSAAVVDLEDLCLEATKLADTCLSIVDQLQALVVSLQEQR